jgi:tetratricopeptide (TPR) repeat protein/tRNA A-37 threonylcarbamoyl transferase component Bud32
MADDNRILELVEEALCSELTPEEVCANDPELLTDVRARLDECRRVDLMFEGMFPSTPPPRILSPQSQPGAPLPQIPGYEVLAVLGRGGHGIVYRVKHLKLKRVAALKMLLTGQYASPAELARFMREAEAIAALQHPNIVQIYEVGEVDGRPYFTMEFVGGGSLAQKLRGVPQPAQYTVSVLESLARAIHTAHLAGIIHRDVKPANVLLAPDGTPKISDFGLARYLEGQGDVTLGPAKVGTPSYMAPEQVVGKPGTVGPPADIYGLGATLYELLTGRPPFRADTSTETERQVLAQEAAPPSRLNAKVPRDLETICLKCLQKEPARRYESAAALADDLVRYREGRPIRARRMGWGPRSWRWCRRKPAAAALIAIAFALLGSAIGGGLWLEKQQTERRIENVRHDSELRNEVSAVVVQAISLRNGFHFREARALLEQTQDRVWPVGPDVLRQRLQRARADLELAQRLDDARSETLALYGGTNEFWIAERHEPWGAERQYLTALANAGFAREGDDSNVVASRVNQSAVRAEIVAGLDDWASITRDPKRLIWILAIARGADPDPARNSVRQPELWQRPGELMRFAQALKPEELSPQLAVALARRAQLGRVDSVQFLVATQMHFPQDFWVNFQLGAALSQFQRWEEALGYCRAALALRPDSSIAQNNVGAVLDALGRRDDALRYLHESLRLEPNNPWADATLGNVLRKQGKVDEAISQLQQAIRAEPGASALYNFLGLALADKGQRDEAIAAYRNAINIDPDSTEARFNLGLALRDMGRFDEAVDWLRQITRLDPKDVAALCQLGLTLRDMGRADEAIGLFQQALRLEPELYLAHYGLQSSLFAAARAAILDAAGQGAQGSRLTESERTDQRRQALALLRANLAVRTDAIARGERGWPLEPWQIDPGLFNIRDPAELAKLPNDERKEWQRFWADVGLVNIADPVVRARGLAARGDWTGAADAYALVFKDRVVDNGSILFENAAISLLKGNRPGYTKTCDRMVEIFGKTSSMRSYHLARACTLAPDALADLSLVNRIAEKELQGNSQQFWSMTEQGALAYRSGKFQDAVPHFELSLNWNPKPGVAVLNWLWLALADQRLGKTDEARRWLEKAQKWLDQFRDGMPADAETEYGLHLHNWLEANVLRREAEALIPSLPREQPDGG